VSLGRRIDALIRELQQIRDQVDKIEASAGTLDRVMSVLKT
jgi:hypothetical protein